MSRLGDVPRYVRQRCYASTVLDIPPLLLLVDPGHHHTRALGDVRGLQATASRYTTFSVLAVASIYALLAKMVFATTASVLRTVLLLALFGIILLSAGVSYRDGIEVGRAQEAPQKGQRTYWKPTGLSPTRAW